MLTILGKFCFVLLLWWKFMLDGEVNMHNSGYWKDTTLYFYRKSHPNVSKIERYIIYALSYRRSFSLRVAKDHV